MSELEGLREWVFGLCQWGRTLGDLSNIPGFGGAPTGEPCPRTAAGVALLYFENGDNPHVPLCGEHLRLLEELAPSSFCDWGRLFRHNAEELPCPEEATQHWIVEIDGLEGEYHLSFCDEHASWSPEEQVEVNHGRIEGRRVE